MSEGSKPPKAPPVQVTQVKIVDIDIPFDSMCRLFITLLPALLAVAVAFGGGFFLLWVVLSSLA
jgi:hypothetical protein